MAYLHGLLSDLCLFSVFRSIGSAHAIFWS